MNQSVSVLKNYIQSVLMLEKNKYELEQSIRKLESSIVKLRKIEYPTRKIENKQSYLLGALFVIIPIAILLILIIIAEVSTSDLADVLLLFSLIMVPIVVLSGINNLIFTKKNNAEIEKETAEAEKEKMVIDRENTIIQSNNNLSNAMINHSISEYSNALTSITKTLDTYYSENIIYPKYRNLTALMYIFEYFDSGRATTLVEAYNFYEEEWRLDKIISKLDLILEKLDTIISYQFDILQSIKENTKMIQETGDRVISKANEICKSHVKINQSLDSIKENVEITQKAALLIEANQYYERNWNNMRGTYDRLKISQ